MTVLRVKGFEIHKGHLDPAAQAEVLEAVRGIVRAAPLFHPTTSRGQQMSVRMTSAGDAGWTSDRKGYRYQTRHPNGMPWPPIPDPIRAVWTAISGSEARPTSCLVNFYAEGARMGIHQDRDEEQFDAPVVSVSLGAPGLFRMGGTERSDPTSSIWLESGDCVVMGGPARLAFHGIDRIKPGPSQLIPGGGRVNVTLRAVNPLQYK
ncbi:MAG: alpha-ketoglutarate-dependent dioxygenase AlkB [Pseudomonadota bacterium]